VTVDVRDVTVDEGDLAADRARLEVLRSGLGAQLATYRTAAGVSQPQLGQVLGRTRTMISKIEHGTRALPGALWRIADDLCRAEGALVAEYEALAQAQQDYRDRCRTHRHQRQIQQAGVKAQAAAREGCPGHAGCRREGAAGGKAGPETVLVNGGLAEELAHVVTKLVRAFGRRDAIRTVGSVLAAVSLSGLDPDEYMRLAHAVSTPSRVDAQVINNLAATLAYCKRLEDKLGPCQVLDTVMAQHRLVHCLLIGDCPDQLRKSLSLVDSNMASAIGVYLIDMGQPKAASRYFGYARKAAHDADNPAYAAYAASHTSFTAFLRGDTPTALDSAAAARSLAARTGDPRLKALAEQMAAAAYALDGQHRPSMTAGDRAHDMLTNANGGAPDSPAYWVDHAMIGANHSILLALLGKPHEAVEAASTALTHFDQTYVRLHALCEVRLGHALILSKEISEAAHVLGDAADQAHLSPRLTADLLTARALMQPWDNTPAIRTLDAQLHTYGLLTARPIKSASPRPTSHPDQLT
jgi:transcriptional regulator with XRE-family HTH domain